MVNQSLHLVARKYAQACLHVCAAHFEKDDLHNLVEMSDFLRENHRLVFFLGLPIISQERKKFFLYELAQRFQLNHLIDRLIHLLLHDKRLFLLADVLRLMSQLYREDRGILEFSISSYPRISANDLNELKQFLARSTGCAIIYTDHEDKNLIAGIRMESTTYLWEYSIAQQLRDVAKRTMR